MVRYLFEKILKILDLVFFFYIWKICRYKENNICFKGFFVKISRKKFMIWKLVDLKENLESLGYIYFVFFFV